MSKSDEKEITVLIIN